MSCHPISSYHPLFTCIQDVLLGKGSAINNHPGNQSYRKMVDSQKAEFASQPIRARKRAIAMSIIDDIHSSGGRFLMEDPNTKGHKISSRITGGDSVAHNLHPNILEKVWIIVDPNKALTKVMHRLREKQKEQVSDDSSYSVTRKIERRARRRDEVEKTTNEIENVSTKMTHNVPHGIASGVRDRPDSTSCASNSISNTDDPSLLDVADSHSFLQHESTFQSSGVDEELDPDSSHEFHPWHDSIDEQREFTLRDWLKKSQSDLKSNSLSESKKSISGELQISLKLVEFLIEAEKEELDGSTNPIPLASIASKNVLLRTNVLEHRNHKPDGDSSGILEHSGASENGGAIEYREVIEYAWIISCLGDNPVGGEVSSRLFALGLILYELFAGEDLSSLDDTLQNKDFISSCISKLEIPSPLCTLLKRLFGCDGGTYISFADMHTDLQLLIDDPLGEPIGCEDDVRNQYHGHLDGKHESFVENRNVHLGANGSHEAPRRNSPNVRRVSFSEPMHDSNNDQDEMHQSSQLTVRQWMERSKPGLHHREEDTLEYIKRALPRSRERRTRWEC